MDIPVDTLHYTKIHPVNSTRYKRVKKLKWKKNFMYERENTWERCKDGIQKKKGRNSCTVGRRVERNADALVKPYVSLERESQSDEGKGRQIVANTYVPSMCDHKYMERQRDGKDARGAETTKRATGAEGQGRTSEEHVCRCCWLRESKMQTGKPYVPNVKFVHSRKRVRPRGRQRCEGCTVGIETRTYA